MTSMIMAPLCGIFSTTNQISNAELIEILNSSIDAIENGELCLDVRERDDSTELWPVEDLEKLFKERGNFTQLPEELRQYFDAYPTRITHERQIVAFSGERVRVSWLKRNYMEWPSILSYGPIIGARGDSIYEKLHIWDLRNELFLDIMHYTFVDLKENREDAIWYQEWYDTWGRISRYLPIEPEHARIDFDESSQQYVVEYLGRADASLPVKIWVNPNMNFVVTKEELYDENNPEIVDLRTEYQNFKLFPNGILYPTNVRLHK